MVAYGALDAMLKLVACNLLAYEDFSEQERLLLGIVSPEEHEQAAQLDQNTHLQTEDDEPSTQESLDPSAPDQDPLEGATDTQG